MSAQKSKKGFGSLDSFTPSVQTEHDDSKISPPLAIKLPQELEKELARITSEFTVDTRKLKDIVKRFRHELDQGLRKTHQNIVC